MEDHHRINLYRATILINLFQKVTVKHTKTINGTSPKSLPDYASTKVLTIIKINYLVIYTVAKGQTKQKKKKKPYLQPISVSLQNNI